MGEQRNFIGGGGRKSIVLLEYYQVWPPAHPSDLGGVEVKAARWLEVAG